MKLRERVHDVARVQALVAALAAGVMMLTVTLDVVRRSFQGRSVPGASELTVLLIVLIIFLGLAEAERTDTHVRMRLVTSRLSPRIAAVARTVALSLAVGMLLWFAYATGLRARQSFITGEYQFGLARFPIWPARMLIPVGFIAVALETALRAVDAARAALGRAEIPDADRGWTDGDPQGPDGVVLV